MRHASRAGGQAEISGGQEKIRGGRPRLHAALIALPPASWAVVMGTGIIATGLELDGEKLLSYLPVGIASLAWLGLATTALAKLRMRRDVIRTEWRAVASLTSVAATAVLGSAYTLLGYSPVGIVLLVIATVLFAGLLVPVLSHWSSPNLGSSFLLVVAIESLGVAGATVASHARLVWLLPEAVAAWLLGLVFYLFVLSRFDLRQLLHGRGDHWIAGGALAISALAAGQISLTASSLLTPDPFAAILKTAGLVLWVAAALWLPLLVGAEVARPRLRYELLRWATVFPVGMYSCCSLAVGLADRQGLIADFGRVWIWVSVALWVIVFGALVRQAAGAVSEIVAPSTAAA